MHNAKCKMILWGSEREIPFHHAITLAKFYRVSLDYIAGLTNNKQGGK